eukprot:6207635-Prymnesium_polylepis.2
MSSPSISPDHHEGNKAARRSYTYTGEVPYASSSKPSTRRGAVSDDHEVSHCTMLGSPNPSRPLGQGRKAATQRTALQLSTQRLRRALSASSKSTLHM